MTTWHIYECPPIDHGWNIARTFKEVIANYNGCEIQIILDLMHDYSEVIKIIEAVTSWEGDFNIEPHLFALPNPNGYDFMHGFIWKQSNNGSTYIASPCYLWWIEGGSFSKDPKELVRLSKKLGSSYCVMVDDENYLKVGKTKDYI